MKWINRLYIIFVGILLAITTGYGVAAFYPEPKMPVYPQAKLYLPSPSSCYQTPASQNSPDCKKYLDEEKQRQAEDAKKQEEYQAKLEAYQNTNAAYTRTAIFFGIAIGALFAILGLMLIKISRLVSNGLMFAGVLTAVSTRILVSFASLGSKITGTAAADRLGYVQFGILLVLSVAVIVVGATVLKDEPAKK